MGFFSFACANPAPMRWLHPALRPVAQKRGVTVFLCAPGRDGNIPPRATLLEIEKEAAKLAHEHLLISSSTTTSNTAWAAWMVRNNHGQYISGA